MSDPSTSVLAAATETLERGWSPLPIPMGSKAPKIEGWTELRYDSPRALEDEFQDCNIGLILGQASRGLVDVDLDCTEARLLAPSFLPQTSMRHGRASAPDSHWWYTVEHEIATLRFQDPTNRSTLLEIRSTGAQTVIPPSVHPSGEELGWTNENIGTPRELSRARLGIHVRVLAAAALLSRHWPEKGGRHDAVLALAGGLLRSGWSERNASHFVAELARVSGDEESSVRRKDVETTAARIENDRDVKGWPTLAQFVGERVVEKVREWLNLTEDDADTEEEEPTEVRNRKDVGQALTDGVEPPEWLLPGVFYRNRVHWWHGEPGDGKTFLMLGLSLQLMREGHKVMFVDEESGLPQTTYRLQGYGADAKTLSEKFIYFDRPGITMSSEDLHSLFYTVHEEKPDLVIFDSVADLLDQAGLSENENEEVTRWAKTVLEPLKFEYGASVVCIDHVTKSKDSRGKYAVGAGAKKRKSDTAWHVKKVKDFSATRLGLIRIEADKDRDGWAEPRVAFRIGGQGGKTVLELVDQVQVGNKLPEGEVEQRIVEFLKLNAECELDAQTTSQIEGAVTGKNDAIRTALAALVSDVQTGIRLIEKGRTRRFWYEDLGTIELDFRDMDE